MNPFIYGINFVTQKIFLSYGEVWPEAVQWVRVKPDESLENIASNNRSSYWLQLIDLGSKIYANVTIDGVQYQTPEFGPILNPFISGNGIVGEPVFVNLGEGADITDLSFEWRRVISPTEPTFEVITGETSQNYTLSSADAGKKIYAVVYENEDLIEFTKTAEFGPIDDLPSVTSYPYNNGSIQIPYIVSDYETKIYIVGETLSLINDGWSGEPFPTFTYQWQRSASGESGWQNITGATGSTYKTTQDDAKQRIRCVVTGTNTIEGVEHSYSQNSNLVQINTIDSISVFISGSDNPLLNLENSLTYIPSGSTIQLEGGIFNLSSTNPDNQTVNLSGDNKSFSLTTSTEEVQFVNP